MKKKVFFSKGDETNWCYKLCTIPEVFRYTLPIYSKNDLLENYFAALLKKSQIQWKNTRMV